MHVDKMMLKNYRNLKNLELELTPHVNIFYGQNAQGKTNLLESIYFVRRVVLIEPPLIESVLLMIWMKRI